MADAEFDIHYDPITVNSNPVTVTLQGLDNVQETLTVQTPQPLKSETKSDFNFPGTIRTNGNLDLAITQPIRSEAKAELDIKPLALDQCLTIRIAPLPPTKVRQPYQQHFGLTLFGIEWFGINVEGELQVIISDLPRKPSIVWGTEQVANPEYTFQKRTPPGEVSQLRIRLDY
jgi:hypothetical protein